MSRYMGPAMVIAAFAFFMPVAYAVFLHRDEIFKTPPIEPNVGHLIFLTSPT